MIQRAKDYVKELFSEESSGHDYFHTLRVAHLAETIAREESNHQVIDMDTVLLIALLHDVDDRKLSPDTWKQKDRARAFLKKEGLSDHWIDMILLGIEQISYKGTDSVSPELPEAKIVQDADRLDAIGAIGIARAFAFGGSRGRLLYDPAEPPRLNMDGETYASSKGHTINHFYEKLLLLKDMMNTETGKQMAAQRHAFMETYLQQFYEEWDGKR